MKKIIGILLFLTSFFALAQHTISGSFTPADEYSWLIAYRLRPGHQNYIADTAIKNGKFTLKLPENSPQGTYRLVYAVPQEEFYFDVLYSGKEDIELQFTAENGALFLSSKENILRQTYFSELNTLEQEIVSYYTNKETSKSALKTIFNKIKSIQKNYTTKSEGMLVQTLIKANQPYIPTTHETVYEYIENRKKNYFNALNFNNLTLQASGLLTEKVINYVFTALPLGELSSTDLDNEMQKNLRKVDYFTQGISADYRLHLFHKLWTQAAAADYNPTSDFIFKHYIKELATETKNLQVITDIERHNRLRIGAIAPEIEWIDKEVPKNLSSLAPSNNYVLIFWSSSCSHCLKELPALHTALLKHPNTKVLAIGLEDDNVVWDQAIVKMPGFSHALALEKWESKYAKLYDIHKTPSYFILDSEKRFIATPESDKEVIRFLNAKE